LGFSTNWKEFFIFWMKAKKEKVAWFYPHPQRKILFL